MSYPVKYAILEVKESQRYEKITLGFIVSKCYLLSSTIKYLEDGTSKTSHIVFFPYNNIREFKYSNLDSIKPDKIRVDYYGTPWAVDEVSQLFDTFEEAKESAIKMNNDFRKNIIYNRVAIKPIASYTDNYYDELVKEADADLEACMKYEEFIALRTSDMVITKDEDVKCKLKN